MTEKPSYTVQSRINEKRFMSFAVFETMCRRKRWKAPVLFAGIISVFAGICFAQAGKREQATLMGSVLLLVGLGLPVCYLIHFYASIRKESKRRNLDGGQIHYQVRLSHERIEVSTENERVEFLWQQVLHTYWVEGCIYLYLNEQRAYLLPENPESEEIWAMIVKLAGQERAVDLRK